MFLHPLFTSVPSDERAALADATVFRRYKRDEVVVAEGEARSSVICVASGLLRVMTRGEDERSTVTSEFLRKDEFFLEGPGRLEPYTPTSTVTAALRSEVFEISISSLKVLSLRHPEVALGLLAQSTRQLQRLRKQVHRVLTVEAESLVADVLKEMTRVAPAGEHRYDKRITQALIASYSGLSREHVNKVIRSFEERGLVRKDDEGVWLDDSVLGERPAE